MKIVDTSGFHVDIVDIVDIDMVPEPLKTAILAEGVVLFEKS
ncbi:MAG: hypothetical protein ABIJ86_01295 [Spirochaetota bacterium]